MTRNPHGADRQAAVVSIRSKPGLRSRPVAAPEHRRRQGVSSPLAAARASLIKAVSEKRSSEQIAGMFGTSSELVEYRIKRLGLWRDHVGKQITLSPE